MTAAPVTPADREAVIARLRVAGTEAEEIRDGLWDGFYFGDDYAPDVVAAEEALDAAWRARNPAEAALWP